MLPLEPDLDEIHRALALILAPDMTAELRIPETHRGTVSGYYQDAAALARDAARWSGRAPAIYFTPNPVHPDLLARACNRAVEYCKHTSQDQDILRRRWLLIDFDAVRPAGISASDAEHDQALDRARACREYLIGAGWPAPLLGDSGNGGHVLCRVDLPNDPDAEQLAKRCLLALGARFSDDQVTVDPKTFNAARIWKLYGTLAAKGDPLPHRPHRLARLLEPGDPVTLTPVELLAALAEQAPAPPRPLRHLPVPVSATAGAAGRAAAGAEGRADERAGRGDYTTLDVVSWFTAHGAYGRALAAGRHAVLCPWESEHTAQRGAEASDTVVWEAEPGRWPEFHCAHAHCDGRQIRDVMERWGDADRFCREQRPHTESWPAGAVQRRRNGAAGAMDEEPPPQVELPRFWPTPPDPTPGSVTAGDARAELLRTIAGRMRRQGLEKEEIRAALTVMNQRRCQPPLDDPELEAITEQVGRYAPAEVTDWRLSGEDEFTGIEPIRRVGSDPPRFEVTVKGKPVVVTHVELKEYERFRTVCLAKCNFLPVFPADTDGSGKPLSLQVTWEKQFLIPALERMDPTVFEEAPPDAGEFGAAWQSILHYLASSRITQSRDEIFDDRLFRDDEAYYFRGRALRSWLGLHASWVKLKADELWNVVREYGDGVSTTIRTEKGVVRVWKVPIPTHLESEA